MLALSYATGGLTPAVFRIWNISILIASALVLFGIVRRSVLLWAGSEDPALPSTSLALATSLLRRLAIALTAAGRSDEAMQHHRARASSAAALTKEIQPQIFTD